MTGYIVVDELLDVLNSQACADWLSEQEEYTPASIVEHALETLPTVDAEPVRHGKWIDTNDGGICSMCKSGLKIYKKIRPLISFCPFCGARMESENETD